MAPDIRMNSPKIQQLIKGRIHTILKRILWFASDLEYSRDPEQRHNMTLY